MLHFRRVIRITAEDSPNVRLARAKIAAGQKPDDEVIVPGVLTWGEYQHRLATWDDIRQCVGLRAEFYEGAEVLMFPPAWLDEAARVATINRGVHRKAKAIGIDPGYGVANTSMAAVDEWGLIELVSTKTPNTMDVPRQAIAFMQRHQVIPEKVMFDRGGGGREAADNMRERGYKVRTVSFGEACTLDPRRVSYNVGDRMENKEDRTTFLNRRSEMYWELRQLLDPSVNTKGFAIDGRYTNLRSELAPIPMDWDAEGKLSLRPKNRPTIDTDTGKGKKTLVDLIGHSPDEADALVLAVHSLLHEPKRAVAGAY